MKNILELKSIIELQYILECLIEDYNYCETESDKYFVKLQVIKVVLTREFNSDQILEYMRLNEEKFKPFIFMLESIKPVKKRRKVKINKDSFNINQSLFNNGLTIQFQKKS